MDRRRRRRRPKQPASCPELGQRIRPDHVDRNRRAQQDAQVHQGLHNVKRHPRGGDFQYQAKKSTNVNRFKGGP
eukprot:3401949-Pyramimonas_sp.AAC.1